MESNRWPTALKLIYIQWRQDLKVWNKFNPSPSLLPPLPYSSLTPPLLPLLNSPLQSFLTPTLPLPLHYHILYPSPTPPPPLRLSYALLYPSQSIPYPFATAPLSPHLLLPFPTPPYPIPTPPLPCPTPPLFLPIPLPNGHKWLLLKRSEKVTIGILSDSKA